MNLCFLWNFNEHDEFYVLCDMEIVFNLMKEFDKEKKKVVEELGFGCLLKYKLRRSQGGMAFWMIGKFDICKRAFIIEGMELMFNHKMMENLLGFRDGEVEVDTEALEEDVTADEKLNSHCEMTYVEMSRRLKSLKHDDKKFREVFVLFVMTALLAPNDNDKPKRTWLRVIEDISLIPRMNWAKFAFDRIICSVMGVKEGKSKAFKGLATVLSLLVCEYSTWIEGVEFRTKDLPLISRWDDQMMLKMHKIIVDKFGGYHTDNLMAKLKSEMLKVPVIEVVSARDDSWMLKMEACINQQEAAIEALRAENKRILDALDSIKKELHTVGEKVGRRLRVMKCAYAWIRRLEYVEDSEPRPKDKEDTVSSTMQHIEEQLTEGYSKGGTMTEPPSTEEQAKELYLIIEENEDEHLANENVKEENLISEDKAEHDSKEDELTDGVSKEDTTAERESEKCRRQST
ncbi:hypothetical protein CDL15_Pgr024191 [Punica granatum]|uniref:Uncharacterized protein n=1 Tax=Punica granatum TaxID=22663 RepID=A0A218XWU8_PUNGR|nr:hypothetical protein CDL15_Pgr024191 [Punica granatum]